MKKTVELLILTMGFILSAALVSAVVTTATINSPVNGSTYNADYFRVNSYRVGKISIDLTLDETADYLQISYDGVRYRTLCRDCNSYNRSRFFGRNKNYTLTFRAIDSGTTVSLGSTTFTKDTIPPRIIRQTPRKRKYTNGTDPVFKVVYNELKLGNVTLFYKGLTESTYQNKTLTNCPEGRRQNCNTTLNLASYNNQQLMYYFSVTDNAGNTRDYRPPTIVNVDLTPPTLAIIRPQAGNNSAGRITLEVASDETLNLLQYELDYSNKWIRLCRRCNHRTKRIFISTTGNHTIRIKGTDYVGQTNQTAINLTLI